MVDNLVMRSVYLPMREDSDLRQLAHELKVSKSDLIRSAIIAKLRDWLQDRSRKQVIRDLQLGRRDTGKLADFLVSEKKTFAMKDPDHGRQGASAPRAREPARARGQ